MDNLDKLKILSDLCAKFFETNSWEQLSHQILTTGIQITQADRGTIFIASKFMGKKANNKLESLIATGISEESIVIPIEKGIAGQVFQDQIGIIENHTENNPNFLSTVDDRTSYKTNNILCIPLCTPAGKKLGVLELLNKEGGFEQEDLQTAKILALYAALAFDKKLELDSLEEQKSSLLRERRERLNVVNEEKLLTSNNNELQQLYNQLEMFAESDSSVLIQGESGTGKELIAKYLHFHSNRKSKPFVVINCAAIPESLFEAELFGVAKGAATGTTERKGKIELANGGTLFLDEIGEMPISIQAKLLRALQEKIVVRVGGENEERKVDFRIVAATHRDLKKMIQEESFREDLFYRLNVLNVQLPALRDRKEDIDMILVSLMDHFQYSRGWKKKQVSEHLVDQLRNHNWPGNIRELQNRLERAYILSGDKKELSAEDFELHKRDEFNLDQNEGQNHVEVSIDPNITNLKEVKDLIERKHISKILEQTGGNKTKACELLDISREGLRKALKRHKLAS